MESVDELERSIIDAWKRVGPRVLADPLELAKRLARRRMALMTRPMRPWCLAIRASDTRLEEAVMSASRRRDSQGAQLVEVRHRVLLDAPVLRQLVAPVRIEPPGEECEDVARRLGVTPNGLWTARFRGVFHTHYVRG